MESPRILGVAWGEIEAEGLPRSRDHGARTVILSRGMLLALRTCPATVEYLRGRDIDVQIAETKEAVRLYNERVDRDEAVGGLFHTTC